MANPKESPTTPAPVGIHFQLPLDLLVALDTIRSAIQSATVGRQAISRADVVRLALRRLYLAYLVHEMEVNPGDALALEVWNLTVRQQQAEGTCPDWLFPGQPEAPATPKKSATVREAKNTKKGR